MSVLSFDNRSAEDQQLATQRIVVPFALERKKESPEEAFRYDERMIKDSALFRRGAGLSMIAPSIAPVFQNRASHADHVALVAEEIARKMGLDKSSIALTRSIALMHDLGHPPFSHEGEEALSNKLGEVGLGWNHEQAGLEALFGNNQYGVYTEGVPLTAATLEGVAKRYHRFTDDDAPTAEYRAYLAGLEKKMHAAHPGNSLHLKKYNHVEGQIASVADWISATVTDAQDMVNYNLSSDAPVVNSRRFFDQFRANFPLGDQVADQVTKEMQAASQNAPREERAAWATSVRHRQMPRIPSMMTAFGHELENRLIDDVVDNSRKLEAKYRSQLTHAENVRDLPELLVTFSPKMMEQMEGVKKFYANDVYPTITKQHAKTVALVEKVFDDLVQGKVKMQGGWEGAYDEIEASRGGEAAKKKRKALLVAHYITSNMTDADVLWHYQEHHREEYDRMMSEARTTPRPLTAPPPRQDSLLR